MLSIASLVVHRKKEDSNQRVDAGGGGGGGGGRGREGGRAYILSFACNLLPSQISQVLTRQLPTQSSSD